MTNLKDLEDVPWVAEISILKYVLWGFGKDSGDHVALPTGADLITGSGPGGSEGICACSRGGRVTERGRLRAVENCILSFSRPTLGT